MKLDEDTVTPLQSLLSELHQAFSIDDVCIDTVKKILAKYQSDQLDWSKFAIFSPHRYTRNLVAAGNQQYNVMVLCWGEGMASAIHSHSDAHCFVKVLQGQLKETLYAWPNMDIQSMIDVGVQPMQAVGSEVVRKDEVTYINDSIGLHRMENPSLVHPAVSLHVYSPPFNECHGFDEGTSAQRKCRMTFDSEFGNVSW